MWDNQGQELVDLIKKVAKAVPSARKISLVHLAKNHTCSHKAQRRIDRLDEGKAVPAEEEERTFGKCDHERHRFGQGQVPIDKSFIVRLLDA